MISQIYHGNKIQKITKSGYNNFSNYGNGKNMKMEEIERLIHQMILQNILREEVFSNSYGKNQFSPVSNIVPGQYAKSLKNKTMEVEMSFCSSSKTKKDRI